MKKYKLEQDLKTGVIRLFMYDVEDDDFTIYITTFFKCYIEIDKQLEAYFIYTKDGNFSKSISNFDFDECIYTIK